MSKITVNETVTKSVSFENNLVDVQTALDRCFQFLEEERFDEAHVIIEQVLNIEPNNTDAHVANFLYQFKLTCAEDVVKNFKECATYEDSVFYKRVKRGTQTELAKEFFHYFGQAHEQLDQFNIEQERIRKEEDLRKKDENNFTSVVFSFAWRFLAAIYCVFLSVLIWSQAVDSFWFGSESVSYWVSYWLTCVGLLALTGLFLFLFFSAARKLYCAIKKKRQKQLDQQKTDQAAD